MRKTDLIRNWLTKTNHPFIFEDTYDQYLSYTNLSKLGLYIHIPFCRSICDFCPYCKVIYEKNLVTQYIEALKKEISIVGSQSDGITEITSLYIGGGSPALCAEELKEVISEVNKYFHINEDIGVELHPSDVNDNTLQALKEAGITKLSIGLQSFDKDCLHLLGREPVDYETLFKILQPYSFETISIDFIFAIPGQTFDSLKHDIDAAFSLGANHVAIYPFIEFSFNKQAKAMEEKEKRALLEQIIDYCEKKGYQRTSIWTFAKGKHEYSSMTRENFLGFGCSATTLLMDQFKVNTFSIEAYIDRIKHEKLPTALTCRFTLGQRMIYFLFWTSYSTIVDPKDFKRFFGKSLTSRYGLEVILCQIFGFVKKQDGIYKMTTKGTYYYHYFEGFYTLAYIDKMWNLMRNEAFPKGFGL